MSEQANHSYPLLFQVQILHHYWLDEGALLFDALPASSAEQYLHNYDVRRFLTVTPTAASAKALRAYACLFKATALGFIVLASGSTVLPQDFQLEFVLTVNNPEFFNYTALTLQPQTITALYQEAENKTCRYKKNVAVLSNLTGDSRTDGNHTRLYLSKAIPALSDNDPVEALVKIGDTLMQLSSDQPNAQKQLINAQWDQVPVFVHQGDMPADGVLLDGIPDSVFALIRLSAFRADKDEFSFINAQGQAKQAAPVFQIRFKNRSTIWQYYNGRTGKTVPPLFVEPAPLPLTFFGNASTVKPKKLKPASSAIKAQLDNSAQPKVLGLISEIFE